MSDRDFDDNFEIPRTHEVLEQAVKDALALVPEGTPIEIERLTEYVLRYGNGQYIKKADIPPGVTRELLESLILRATSWSHWPHRRDQLQHPDMTKIWSHAELRVCYFCRDAVGYERKDFAFSDVVRIPFDTAPLSKPCHCSYISIRKNVKASDGCMATPH